MSAGSHHAALGMRRAGRVSLSLWSRYWCFIGWRMEKRLGLAVNGSACPNGRARNRPIAEPCNSSIKCAPTHKICIVTSCWFSLKKGEGNPYGLCPCKFVEVLQVKTIQRT